MTESYFLESKREIGKSWKKPKLGISSFFLFFFQPFSSSVKYIFFAFELGLGFK